jgi:hypothetical protein
MKLNQMSFPFFNTFMSEELATTNSGGSLIDVPQGKYDQQALESVSAGDSKFLPRLQLMTSRSEKVELGEFPANHFALIESQNFKDLGESVDILLVAWRPKALDTSGDDIITCYDPKFDENNQPTGEFKRIQEKSKETNSGCMYGPEYLVYIPSVKRYATFFCGSITLRFEAPAFTGRLGNAATLRPIMIDAKKKKQKYFSTKVYDCTTVFDVPERDEIAKVSNEFLNPSEDGPEGTTEEEAASTERAQ